MEQVDRELISIVQAMGEIYSRTISSPAAVMFLADLAGIPKEQLKNALKKCRQELRNFPTVADVLSRVSDGRPGVEEAWAMLPKSESQSVVWTAEMAEAFGQIRDLLSEDVVMARMAFKEIYQRLVAENRRNPPSWTVSLGHDKNGRDAVILAAVEKQRIPVAYARHFLVEPPASQSGLKLLRDISTKNTNILRVLGTN